MSLLNDKLTPIERAEVLRQAGFNVKKDRGQINNIKNICYEDTQGDLCINLDTGQVNDFGDHRYSGDIFTLLEKALNKDFKGVVEFIEDTIRRDLSDKMDGKNQSGAMYSGSSHKVKKKQEEIKNKKNEPVQFWDKKKWVKMEKCQEVLEKRGIVDSMDYIQNYDGIGKQVLLDCNCGIYGFNDYEFGLSKKDYNSSAFFIFPYASGAMLYRRTEDGKDVRHIKGSSVKDSFFNVGKNEEKHNAIFIMKSPRECMNFMQYCTDHKVIGLAQGENVKELTIRQKKQILKLVDQGECSIQCVLDCDDPDAYENSLIFCQLVNEVVENRATVHLVNLHRFSEGKFKDFTDIVQYAMKKGEWNFEDTYKKLDDKSGKIIANAVTKSEVIR